MLYQLSYFRLYVLQLPLFSLRIELRSILSPPGRSLTKFFETLASPAGFKLLQKLQINLGFCIKFMPGKQISLSFQ